MSYIVTRYVQTDNPFYPYCPARTTLRPFFVGYKGVDRGYYCFYSQLQGRYLISNTVSPFGLIDDENAVTWSLIADRYPCFSGRLNGEFMYIYCINNTYYASPTRYLDPISFNFIYYDEDTQSVKLKSTKSDYYKANGTDWKYGVTFTGYGKYDGLSFTVQTYKTTNKIWQSSSTSTSAFCGVYTPMDGNSSSNKYVGNKYWQYDGVDYILSPNREVNDETWVKGERVYSISNIEYIYNAIDHKHRWVIWGDDTKTWGYENNQDYPIAEQDYVYTPFGKDGLTNITLTFKGYTLYGHKDKIQVFDYARVY